MDRFKSAVSTIAGDFLWAIILVPILAISWLGFYTIARAVGVPVLFAAGMSAAFDGVAIFAARIGLKHRRKGFSGYLARIVVIAFIALGAFVQSFHAESTSWIHAHSWVVWAAAPIAAGVAYELHLGWANRKRLVRMGYSHPSAKSGFGPATWCHYPRSTFHEYRTLLVARRTFIAKSNLERFALEEAAQPSLEVHIEPEVHELSKAQFDALRDVEQEVERQVQSPSLTVVPTRSSRSARKSSSRPPARPAARTARPRVPDDVVAIWCTEQGFELGFNGRVPIAGLRAYRAAHRATSQAS